LTRQVKGQAQHGMVTAGDVATGWPRLRLLQQGQNAAAASSSHRISNAATSIPLRQGMHHVHQQPGRFGHVPAALLCRQAASLRV
jgi:hypothetical protein